MKTLSDLTVGVVGFGCIEREVVRRLLPFKCPYSSSTQSFRRRKLKSSRASRAFARRTARRERSVNAALSFHAANTQTLVDGDTLPNDAAALNEAADADVIVVGWTILTAQFIRKFAHCRAIVRHRCGIGYDNVDYDAATAAGIIIAHSPTYGVDEAATQAFALLLACIRNIVGAPQIVAGGGWSDNPTIRQWRMTGRTVGLVGLGNSGSAMALQFSGWQTRLLAVDAYVPAELASQVGVQLVTLPTLCRESDYISLHPPLLPEPNHLISGRELVLKRPGVILVNTARGPGLDEMNLKPLTKPCSRRRWSGSCRWQRRRPPRPGTRWRPSVHRCARNVSWAWRPGCAGGSPECSRWPRSAACG